MRIKKIESPNKGTTQDFVDIKQIKDDVIVLKDNSCVLIVEIAAVNYWLLSVDEQESIIGSFSGFLNSLSFPIQILILSKKMNISNYIEKVDKQKERAQNNLTSQLLENYSTFIKGIVKKNTILEKKFYCVLPFSYAELGLTGLSAKVSEEFIITKAKTALYPKRDHLLRILNKAGLAGRVLSEQSISELFYNIYNPSSTGRAIAPINNYTQAIYSNS